MTTAWLLGLFSWNVLFGVFGGVLLCLHDDLSVHVESDGQEEGQCLDDCRSSSADSLPMVAESGRCLDFGLSGVILQPARPDRMQVSGDLKPTYPSTVLLPLDEVWPGESSMVSLPKRDVSPVASRGLMLAQCTVRLL